MKYTVIVLLTLILFSSCENKSTVTVPETKNGILPIEGSWKMIYADIRENDSIHLKDLSNTDFIKIINKSHFAFFNQERGSAENFFGGAGTYTLTGDDYTETLSFLGVTEVRGHVFPFKIEIKGDTLIQQGQEKVEGANIDRYIVEKYIRIK